MRQSIIVLVCALSAPIMIPGSVSAESLEAAPAEIDFGTFNTLEQKKSLITLKNKGRYPFVVEKIKADCSCVRVKIESREIRPNSESSLEVEAMQATEGDFAHWVLLVPKDGEHHRPLRVPVRGHVVQPVSWAMGWQGKTPIPCDATRRTDMGVIHQLAVRPTIYIREEAGRFDIRTSVIDVNSDHFELCGYRFISRPDRHVGNAIQTVRHPWLILNFAPREAMKPGVVRDTIEVNLAENVNLRVPFICRVVGDVYAYEQRLNLGSLVSPEPKELAVHFSNGHPRWECVNWAGTGPLARGITVDLMREGVDDSCLRLRIAVDNSRLAEIPHGYVFSHVTLFESKPSDEDMITVLVDAFY